MSTGGPPAGIHASSKKDDGGLVNKLKDAIKPGSSSAKKDNTTLPGNVAHESQDRGGGGGVLNALKPGSDNMEGNSGSSTLDAAREGDAEHEERCVQQHALRRSGVQAGHSGRARYAGATPSNSTV
ncbi:hypothetical protein PG995_014886 [Apiospora arundinis]